MHYETNTSKVGVMQGEKVPWLPSVIFGCVSIIAAGTTLRLRETNGVALPDTIHDLTTASQHTEGR